MRGRRRRRAGAVGPIGGVILTAALAVATMASGARAATVRTLKAFDPAAKQTPENLAIASDGTVYVAENPPSRIMRVARTGRRTIVAGRSDGLDNPSAVAFGATAATRSDLYITNAAYFGSHPSLQQTRLAR